MLTTMVAGFYETNGNEMYTSGTEFYTEFCFGVQDMCSHLPGVFHGPASVRMVSNNGTAALPVPVQVPPGHVVQQIVDENGTLRYVIFSPPMAVALGSPYNPTPTPNTAPTATATPYFAYPQPPYPPPQFHPQVSNPLQPGLTPQSLHGTLHPTQHTSHSVHQGASPPPGQHLQLHKDDRTQRPFYKFKRKSEVRPRENKLVILPQQSPSISSKKESEKKKYKLEEATKVNGTATNHVSEDEEVAWIFTEFLSSIKLPVVSEVSSRSAFIHWTSPEISTDNSEKKIGDIDLQQSELLYDVLLSDKGKDGNFKVVYSGSELQCSLSSLKPATEYYICVQALLDDLRGNPSESVSFKTQSCEPDSPQPPRLCLRTKTSLTLRWNTPSDNGAKVTGYALEYDEGFGNGQFVEIYSGPQKQFKVTRLNAASCYRFRVAAINEKGRSALSEISCFNTCGNAPSQPLPPSLKQAYINKVHLEWQKRSSDEDFTLQMEDESIRHGFLSVYNGRETSYVCTGLRGNTEYRFRLCASNEEGCSPWSRIVIFCTLPDKLSCPSKPLPKGHIHASCFRVVWDSPRDCRSSSITKYVLEVDRGAGFEAVYTGPETEYFLENLLPGTSYRVRVACISASGHSPYSEISTITTAAVCPGKCSSPQLHGKPKALYLHLKWASPDYNGGSAITEFEVDMTSSDNSTQQVYKGSETTCLVSGLLPGRSYLFQVRAYNKVGAGPWSDPLEVISGAGPPDAPRNSKVLCNSSHIISIMWEEPVNNGAAITGYCLEWSRKDEDEFVMLYQGSNQSYEIQDVSPATQYYFRIQAINGAGAGPYSETISCCTLPSIPDIVSLTNVTVIPGASMVQLTWQEPDSHGADIITYNVELGDYLYNTEDNTPEICIDELTPETVYRVRIQAVNSVGEGPFSQSIKLTTLRPPPCPPELACLSSSHNSLKLRWGEGRNPEFIYYTLEMANRSGSFVPVYQGTCFSHKVSKLQETTAYNFRICASSDAGEGPYSQVYTFHTTKAPPPALKAPRICSISETTCRIEWPAAKAPGDDQISYQVQLLSSWESEYKLVHKGSDISYTLENLEPHTRYAVRVAAVRHCRDGSADMIGAFSPSTTLTTLASEPAPKVLTTVSTPSSNERRQLTDQHWAAIILFSFTLFSILMAVVLEHVLSLTTPL